MAANARAAALIAAKKRVSYPRLSIMFSTLIAAFEEEAVARLKDGIDIPGSCLGSKSYTSSYL